MQDHPQNSDVVLEVASPGAATEFVPVTHTPFLLGRGREAGNHLTLEDRRISRSCAAIVAAEEGYRLEDRGHRQGVFVNGARVERRLLNEGDVIEFGMKIPTRLRFIYRWRGTRWKAC